MLAGLDVRPPVPRPASVATSSTFRCSTVITSPTRRVRASCTPRPAMAARTSRSGWSRAASLQRAASDTTIPFTVGGRRQVHGRCAGLRGRSVITDKGKKGDANKKVIEALVAANALIARGRLKHQYPHSWRSKKPVIFRNTPQWFVYMDQTLRPTASAGATATLRDIALKAIAETQVRAGRRPEPAARHDRTAAGLGALAPARLGRADHRVRAQGNGRGHPRSGLCEVGGTRRRGSPMRSPRKAQMPGSPTAPRRASSTGLVDNPDDWEQVTDILDVWFDFRLDARVQSRRPQSTSRRCRTSTARSMAAPDTVMYLEGSDQHRGWFHSSLLESCGTRGRAPYDVVLTHGFVLDEKGQKMSKSLGNVVAPQTRHRPERRRHPAPLGRVVRLYRRSAHRPGNPEDLRRNLPQAAQFAALDDRRAASLSIRQPTRSMPRHAGDRPIDAAPARRTRRRDPRSVCEIRIPPRRLAAFELHERRPLRVLFRRAQGRALLRTAHRRKKRKAALTVISRIYDAVTAWLAPILSFTAEEAWLARNPSSDGSVHLQTLP